MIGRVAISSVGLVKRYGRRRALDGFTLDVPTGCVMGLVGPNGAGKTTWMMSAVGLTLIDAGRISLLGKGPFDAVVHSGRVAILPQDSELPLEATPESFLVGLGRLQGLSSGAARASAAKILAAVNLADRATASVRSLSHGMRKRLMVAQCFIGDPELVLLDEPMNGLDPEEAFRLRSFIRADAGRRTFVISSHNLDGLERLCTQVAFVEAGRVTKILDMTTFADRGISLEMAYIQRHEQA